MAEPILNVIGISKRHKLPKENLFAKSRSLQVLQDVSFSVSRGEVLGIVGPSGSGKSTLASIIAGAVPCDAGNIRFRSTDISDLHGVDRRRSRREIGMVFQNPFGSLSPKMDILSQVAEGLHIHRLGAASERRQRAREALLEVGLSESLFDRRPRQLSGGQAQRVALARCLVIRPSFLILDEATASLDVSVKAGIINLIRRMQRNLNIACLFISHDIAIVEHLCDRVAVISEGKLVEEGKTRAVFAAPSHPTTASLVAATLNNRQRVVMDDALPNPSERETSLDRQNVIRPSFNAVELALKGA
ncbi:MULTISPECIES: ABC transporter ATP-binding protein [Rhizobium]|uniref:ABC transporter ATP-binding protein n=1 Tax=Rhizobium TaxID=379 RepID=UPI00067E9EF9|nr:MULTISPECIES: ATP-binding cassette domain-containing protein [Rhizobium]